MKKLLLLLSFVFAIFVRIDSGWSVVIGMGTMIDYYCGEDTSNPPVAQHSATGTETTPSNVCTPPVVSWHCVQRDRTGNFEYDVNAGSTFTIEGNPFLINCYVRYTSLGVTCSSGTYLPANSSTCTTCPSGYVCPGGTFNTGVQSDQGKYYGPAFSVTTSATNEFLFDLSAQGAFYVDCGTGGTLSSDDSTANAMISGATIDKNDRNYYTFKCSYSNSAIRTIQFGGTATNYIGQIPNAAISFFAGSNDTNKRANAAKITAVSGDLSAIFPYISANGVNGAQPLFYKTFYMAVNLQSVPGTLFSGYTTGCVLMFYETFLSCTNLTSIPSGLFSNITTGADSMFDYTFASSGLTSIPSGLFSNITTSAQYMFEGTFANTKITSIPSNLFSGITTGASRMFAETFYGTLITSIPSGLFGNITTGAGSMFDTTFSGCTSLTSIPENLFSSIRTTAGGMFEHTFSGCTSLTSIPENLFSNFTAVEGLFHATFANCSGLTSIPAGLFSNITTGAYFMFNNTFYGCTSLTSIPENLFSKITSGAYAMFASTFYGCSNLTGYIPPTLFDGLIKNNAATDTFSDTFTNTGMLTSCPSGTTQYAASYTSSWGGKVSCQPNTISLTFDGGSPMSCTLGSTFVPPTPEPRPGYVFTGWKAVTCADKIKRLDPSINPDDFDAYGYKNNPQSPNDALSQNTSDYGITANNTWAVEFPYGTVWGRSKCSATSGDSHDAEWGAPSSDWMKTPSDTNGQNCWCQLTGFTASGNSYTSGPQCTVTASSSWVFYNSQIDGWEMCEWACAADCASYVPVEPAFRAALLDAVGQ